jgi:Beta-xylosidase
MPNTFADLQVRKGYVLLGGQESVASLKKVRLLARKLTSVYARMTTKMEFHPEVYQHSAGLILYYDNMNYVNLRKYYSQTLRQGALSVVHLENGVKSEHAETKFPLTADLCICGRKFGFEWSYDSEDYRKIGDWFETSKLSD